MTVDPPVRKVVWTRATLLFLVWCVIDPSRLVFAEGVVLLKPYNTSPQTEISEVKVFKTATDRTGVIEFEWRNGKREEYQKARVARIVTIPDLAEFPELDASTAGVLTDRLVVLQRLALEYPKLGDQIAPDLESIKKELNWFKQGHKKIEGKWISASDFQKQREAAMTARVNEQMDARFAALAPVLSDPGTDLVQSSQIVAELNRMTSLNPGIRALTTRWTDADSSARLLKTELRAFINTVSIKRPPPFYMAVSTPADIKKIPEEFSTKAKELSRKVSEFDPTRAFPPLKAHFKVEAACVSMINEIANIATKVARGEVPAAATMILNRSNETDALLSNDDAFIKNTLDQCAAALKTTIEDAKAHLRKGKEFHEAQKFSAAIKEYEEANKVLNDPEIANFVKQLRQQTLGL